MAITIRKIACPKDVFIKGIFAASESQLQSLTIDADNAGTYTTLTQDGGSANRIEAYTGYTPNLNQWIHLAYTDDGSKFGGKIYANGIDITSSHTETGNYVKMINGSHFVRMGINSWSTNANLKHRGRIDEVAIFNGTELTQLQIQDLYNGGVGKFYPNI